MEIQFILKPAMFNIPDSSMHRLRRCEKFYCGLNFQLEQTFMFSWKEYQDIGVSTLWLKFVSQRTRKFLIKPTINCVGQMGIEQQKICVFCTSCRN